MLKKTSKFIYFFSILTIAITSPKYAEGKVNVKIKTEPWNLVIDDRYLTWDGLQDTYESNVEVEVTVTGAGSHKNWRVDVRRDDTNWHGDFVLELKKPGKEVTVETTDQEFITGEGNNSYDIQIILKGVSIQISPDAYITTVIYTVTEE